MTVKQSGYETIKNHFYETPSWVTRALLRRYNFSGMSVWEPAAGGHKIARVLVDNGADVWTSDIETYGTQHDQEFDFLDDDRQDYDIFDAIVTNPPYGPQNALATKFAQLALERCNGWVALLLTAKFDSGSTRTNLFRDNYRFAGKIVLLDRVSWMDNGETGTEDHAWFIWRPRFEMDRPPVIFYEGNDEKVPKKTGRKPK